MTNEIKSHVESIVKTLEDGFMVNENGYEWDHSSDCQCGAECGDTCECEEKRELSGFDYIQDVLDINWILNSDRTFKGARILVAFGGPNIWIDTVKNTVEGYWWNESHTANYSDGIDLESALCELWECQ